MKQPATDREILKCIFDTYAASYAAAQAGTALNNNDPYLPIDVKAIAEKLGQKPELLFGQLYYHLDYKHRYMQQNGALVPLFLLAMGDKRHLVNFPYLAAILAGHNQEHLKNSWSLGVSLIALVLSVAALLVNILKHASP